MMYGRIGTTKVYRKVSAWFISISPWQCNGIERLPVKRAMPMAATMKTGDERHRCPQAGAERVTIMMKEKKMKTTLG